MSNTILQRWVGAAAVIGCSVVAATSAAKAATFTVNRTNDNGGVCSATSCSLRQAISAANANGGTDTIGFNIPACGTKLINIASTTLRITGRVIINGGTQPQCGSPVIGDFTSLIELRGPGSSVTPGGLVLHGLVLDPGSSGSQIRGLAINGFSGSGIGVNSSNNTIAENKLGTDATGNLPRPNSIGLGIGDQSSGNNVYGNVISANVSTGINMLGDGNQIYDNLIGTMADGQTVLGNGGDGIATFGANNNEIGLDASLGNTIAFNGGAGVRIGVGNFNAVVGNKVEGNTGLGIQLVGTGANHGQAAPVLRSAVRLFEFLPGPPPRFVTRTTINGTLANVSGTSFRVDLYANNSCDVSGAGEGEVFLATAVVATNGTFSASTTRSSGSFVTAIARSPDGDTSQFSNCAAVGP